MLLDVIAGLDCFRYVWSTTPVEMLAREYNVIPWSSHGALHTQIRALCIFFLAETDQRNQPYTWIAVDDIRAGTALASIFGRDLGILCLEGPRIELSHVLKMRSVDTGISLAILCVTAILAGLGRKDILLPVLLITQIVLLAIVFYPPWRNTEFAAEAIWWAMPAGINQLVSVAVCAASCMVQLADVGQEWTMEEDGRLPIRQRPQLSDDNSDGVSHESRVVRDEWAELSEDEDYSDEEDWTTSEDGQLPFQQESEPSDTSEDEQEEEDDEEEEGRSLSEDGRLPFQQDFEPNDTDSDDGPYPGRLHIENLAELSEYERMDSPVETEISDNEAGNLD
jgi:hypothetical protein